MSTTNPRVAILGSILESNAFAPPVVSTVDLPFPQLPRSVYPLDPDTHWPQPPWETP